MANETVLASWEKKWDDHKIPWHKADLHSLLMKYVEKLVNGRSAIQVFFPMCGKCVDMKWFYDQGHKVVGVEYCEKPIREFFAEQKLQFIVEDIAKINGKVYKTLDDRIKLFCCDIYSFDVDCAGLMDAVWDRGALSAVEKEDRKRYIKLMTSLLAQDCRYLLSVLVYKDWFYSGCPRTVPDDLVHYLYGKKFIVHQLERIIRSPATCPPMLDADHVDEVLWLLILKNPVET